MRDKFPGYFPMADKDKGELFKTATFAFDACVLLNIYSYSEETRDEFLGLLEQIQDRIWIPYQCVKEFLKNRPVRIKDQLDKFDTELKRIKKFGTVFDEAHRERRAHPFYSDTAREDTKSLVDLLTKELEANKAKVKQLLKEDPLRDRLASILDGRVGEKFSCKEIDEIFKEGKRRYATDTPPGFKDKGKKPEPDCYGDLVFWKEIIRYSETKSVDVILVTDDAKPDWWQKNGPEVLGPRPELLQEFREETKKSILIYQGLNFMSRASEHIDEVTVSKEAIDEVKSISTQLSIQHWRSSLVSIREAIDSINSFAASVAESPAANFLEKMKVRDAAIQGSLSSEHFRQAMLSFEKLNKPFDLSQLAKPAIDLKSLGIPPLEHFVDSEETPERSAEDDVKDVEDDRDLNEGVDKGEVDDK